LEKISKDIKIKFPKNQKPIEMYLTEEHIPNYIITRDNIGEYTLWQIDITGHLTKLKTGQTPVKLDEYATEQIMKGTKKIK
jgi:hypothetical protein